MAAKFSGLCRCFMRRLSPLNNWWKGAEKDEHRPPQPCLTRRALRSTPELFCHPIYCRASAFLTARPKSFALRALQGFLIPKSATMRLINTRTGLFEEFIGGNIPKYAILSHTWGEEEVSFTALSDPSSNYKNKKGYRKIDMTCKIASQAGLSYAWVDTCCIDKSSSAELTEAINSMYRWYQRSTICYAFLSDLPPTSSLETALKGCRWFERGWTLQELIAPDEIYFFDRDWNYIGSKRDLVEELSKITGIRTSVL
jgi:hypothetical protein